jgi:hypothetical protein
MCCRTYSFANIDGETTLQSKKEVFAALFLKLTNKASFVTV